MLSKVALVNLFLALTSAQLTTSASVPQVSAAALLEIYVPGADQQPLVGSVIAADTTATTIRIECAPGTSGVDCGVPGQVDVTKKAAPSNTIFDGGYIVESETIAYHCEYSSSVGVCTGTVQGTLEGTPISSSTVATDTSAFLLTVAVTAGAEKLGTVIGAASATGTSISSAARTVGTTTGGAAISTGAANAVHVAGGVVVGAAAGVAALLL